MEKLIGLLKDGKSRTINELSSELGISVEKVKRDIEFLERTGAIERIEFSTACNKGHACNGCTACEKGTAGCQTGGSACASCMPEGGFKNMGLMWEVKI